MRREWAKIGRIARSEAGIRANRGGRDHAVRERTAPATGNVEQLRGESGVRPIECLRFAQRLRGLLHDQRGHWAAQKLRPSDR